MFINQQTWPWDMERITPDIFKISIFPATAVQRAFDVPKRAV